MDSTPPGTAKHSRKGGRRGQADASAQEALAELERELDARAIAATPEAHAAEVIPKRRKDGKLQGRSTGGITLLTPELLREAVALICDGIPDDTAFQSLGVRYSTYRAWVARGEAELGSGERTPYSELVEVVTKARSQGEVGLVRRWLAGDAAGVTWGPSRCAAEYLRATQRRYGDKLRVQLETELTELLSIVERRCSEAGREDILGLILSDLADRDRA